MTPIHRASTIFAFACFALCAAAVSAQTPPASPPPPSSTPTVKLLSPGAEPRRALRYQPVVGATSEVTLTMRMKMAMRADDHAIPSGTIPPMAITLASKVLSVAPNGDAKIQLTVLRLSVVAGSTADANTRNVLEQGLKVVEGMKMTATVNARGVSTGVTVQLAKEVPAGLQQLVGSLSRSMEQMANPLPEAPVGAGASWRSTVELTREGLQLKQTTTTTLVRIEGNVIDLSIEVTQSAPPQSAQLPGLPPGVEARVETYRGGGSSTTRVDLADVLPVSVTGQSKNQTRMLIKRGEEQSRLDIEVEVGTEVTRTATPGTPRRGR